MTFREIATAWFEEKEKSLKPVSLEAYKLCALHDHSSGTGRFGGSDGPGYRCPEGDDDRERCQDLFLPQLLQYHPEHSALRSRSGLVPVPHMAVGHCSQGKPASTYICTGTTEPLLTPKTLRDSLKAVSKKLDIPFLKFQDLRHNFTVRCIRSGCDFVTLMHLLGYTRAQALYDDYKDFFPADAPAAISAQAQALLG